jgi:hypothetical protein
MTSPGLQWLPSPLRPPIGAFFYDSLTASSFNFWLKPQVVARPESGLH